MQASMWRAARAFATFWRSEIERYCDPAKLTEIE
jgi:hypothetical protein